MGGTYSGPFCPAFFLERTTPVIRRLLVACLLVALWLGLTVRTPSLLASAVDVIDVQVAPNLPSGQPVGTTVTWTITASSANSLEYWLSVKAPDRPLRNHVRLH